MDRYIDALNHIYDGDPIKAMEEISSIYTKETHSDELIALLTEVFLTPNLPMFEEVYAENTEQLQQYPYVFNKNFKAFSDNKYVLFPISETIFYTLDTEKYLFQKLEISSKKETKYFFENLKDALYVENEFNEYNLKFLVDNYRKSEDVAYDNHIYLHYTDMDQFSLLLYYCELAPLLVDSKLVFLIGAEEVKMYPIDFKEKFNIDYEAMEFQEIRPEEIKRITVQVPYGQGGRGFANQILDGHPNFICTTEMMCEYGLHFDSFKNVSDFFEILDRFLDPELNLNYLEFYLNAKRVLPRYEMLNTFANLDDFKRFYGYMKELSIKYNISTKKDLLVIEHLALLKFLDSQLQERIPPMLHLMVHNPNHVEDYIKCVDIYDEFPYYYGYAVVRDFIGTFVSGLNRHKGDYGNKDEGHFYNLYHYFFEDLNFLRENQPLNALYSHKFESKIFIRFEDMKLNPKATLLAFAEFLNIPYTKELEICSFFGVEKDYPKFENEQRILGGFTVKSLYKYRSESMRLNDYDIYRMESILFPVLSLFGYKPTTSPDMVFEHKNFFSEPFEFEGEEAEALFQRDGITCERYRKEFFRRAINWSINVMQIQKNNEINIFPILQPKEEYLVNQIYENVLSLPELEDVRIDFLS
ncbi:MAG: hypothetical protein R3Y53_04060 [Bacillota bacterium]